MRKWAYEIVYGTMEKKQYSDRMFHEIIEKRSMFSSREKRFLKRLSYGTIERCVELDAVLSQYSKLPVKKMTSSVRTVLRMALYEIRYMNRVPEAVSCHEAVELLKKMGDARYTGFVNGVLRAVIRGGYDVELKEWEKVSLPEPLYKYFVSRYGKKTTALIGNAFLSNERDITLHINTARISRDEYKEMLRREGVEIKDGRYMPDALVVSGIENVAALPGYKEGWFFVQDESSMLPVACAGIKPGDEVLDVCSAPGGKAMHALLCLEGKGILSARDVRPEKVAVIRENVRRMGYTNVQCKVWDGTVTDPEWNNRADVILADVPCSGIGIIGRKPEIKYHALEISESLVPVQRKILKASVDMLKPGGTLIYSTCTIHEAENEENVHWMAENLGLKTFSLSPYLPEILTNKMTDKGMLQMIPGIHKSDGFFVAGLRKP